MLKLNVGDEVSRDKQISLCVSRKSTYLFRSKVDRLEPNQTSMSDLAPMATTHMCDSLRGYRIIHSYIGFRSRP